MVWVGAVVSDWLEWQLMDRFIAGEPVTEAEATGYDDRQGAIGLVSPSEKRYSPGWATGSWFVPIVNLFRPKQMINDVWRAGGAKPGVLLLGW